MANNRIAALHATVKQAVEIGLSVFPPRQDGSKQPSGDTWAERQRTRATIQELRPIYKNKTTTGIGIFPGAVSGNVECLDFDERGIYDAFKQMAIESGLGSLIDRIEAGYLEHSPNGAHYLYKCSEISGNKKLATRPKRPEEMKDPKDKIKTLIETRGEGGYVIIAPTFGSVNPDGTYDLISGGLDTIPTITPEERQELFSLAHTFHIEPEGKTTWETRKASKAGGRPGDAFNNSATWTDVLSPHGWTHIYSKGDVDYWRRPGKSIGISATTNHKGLDLFHNFSSSTQFDPDKSYTKFHAYTLLNHKGDFQVAAEDLAGKGYGEQQVIEKNKQDTEGALKLIKTADVLISTTRNTDFVVYGMLPRKAFSIIGGAQKDGKTWFALEVATAVSCGRDVFGVYPSQSGRVLFVEGDVPDELIKWRLQHAGYEYRSENFLSLNKFDLLNIGQHLDLASSDGQTLLDLMVNTIRPDLLIIDSLSAFHTVDEKDAAAVKPMIHFVTHLAGKYDMHVALIHHSRKRKKNEEKLDIALDDMIGSNVPLRFASIIYGVQKRKDVATGELQYALTTLGSWFRPIDPVLLKILDRADSEDGELVLDWSVSEFLPKNKIEHGVFSIEKLLRERGAAKRADMLSALPLLNTRTIDRAIARLLELGRLQRHGVEKGPNSYYCLVPREYDKCVKLSPQTLTGRHSMTSTHISTRGVNLSNPTEDSSTCGEGMSNPMSNSKSAEAVDSEEQFDTFPSTWNEVPDESDDDEVTVFNVLEVST